jgi:dipeptidyl aminopeptidase/acylaminoacyl peptidase
MERCVKFYSQGHLIVADLGVPHKGAPCIIVSHGLESSKDGTKWRALAPRLYEAGFACLRFNYRGCGEGQERSSGEFEDTTLSGRIADYRAAIDFIETTGVDANRLGAVGSSFGGMVVLAAKEARIKAVVCLATPAKLQVSRGEHPRMQSQEFFELPSGKRLKTEFFQDMRQYDVLKAVGDLTCPILIVHGTADEIVPAGDAQDLYASVREPKRLVIIEGGNHHLDGPGHLERVIGLTVDWFRQYL